MSITTPDPTFWAGKKVLVTGHTGFKGTWLSLWLERLGAQVSGLALDPSTDPSMYRLVGNDDVVDSTIGDVTDAAVVAEVMERVQPDVIFHLAAQVLVRRSYVDPIETITTNVVGTANVLNEARKVDGLQAIVVITSDKCYENREWHWPYREDEAMGGHDPYSASKGSAELITSSMRRSFFAEPDAALIGSARAGNVIGGGDWSADRLIPDIVKAFAKGDEVVIRMPEAIRPWQHVLEPISGYLVLGERLANGDAIAADGWNFGPADEDAKPVGWMVEQMAKRWGEGAGFRIEPDGGPHEARLLKLDTSKANAELGWRRRMTLDQALEWVIDWYRAQVDGGDMRQLSIDQIAAYEALATKATSVSD
ncbi:MAG: CDP-glucose 4,6-dehydratase [Actinomycetota bacterium]